MNDKDRNNIQRLIGVYEKRVENKQSAINVFKLTDKALIDAKYEITIYKMVIQDLKSLLR